MHNWYVVQTKPKQENLALENLLRQGYNTYYPRIAQAKRRRQRWQQVIEPLFPRYLFVQLAIGLDDFTPIRSTLGVIGLVRFGGQPACVPSTAIDAIRFQEDLLLNEAVETPKWKPGDAIEIASGPFSGLKGIFEKTCGAERVMVFLDMLGRQNRITIETHNVMPAR